MLHQDNQDTLVNFPTRRLDQYGGQLQFDVEERLSRDVELCAFLSLLALPFNHTHNTSRCSSPNVLRVHLSKSARHPWSGGSGQVKSPIANVQIVNGHVVKQPKPRTTFLTGETILLQCPSTNNNRTTQPRRALRPPHNPWQKQFPRPSKQHLPCLRRRCNPPPRRTRSTSPFRARSVDVPRS